MPVLDYDGEQEFEDYGEDQGGSWLGVGEHHCQVVDAEEDEEKAIITWEAVAGPETGKQTKQYVQFTSTKGEKATQQCMAHTKYVAKKIGLLTREAYDAAKAANEAIVIDFNDALGCQAIVKVVEGEKYKDKETGQVKDGRPKVPFYGVFELGHRDYLHVPINADVAAAVGYAPDPFVAPAEPKTEPKKQVGKPPAKAAPTKPAAKPAAKPATAAKAGAYDGI